MKYKELIEFWKKEKQQSFKGWDFSHIEGRMVEEPLPWDYKQVVKSSMSNEKVMLDMGTGGGEFLLSLKPVAGNTYATESYPPNLELSKAALLPFGIEVIGCEDNAGLPFDKEFFDMVINRHEAFCAAEVYRILKPGGIFITQQVGGKNNREMSKFLLGEYPEIIDPDYNLEKSVRELEYAGFSVEQKNEYFPKARFYDVGALVFFAGIIEWEFPGFSVEKHRERLCDLQEVLEKDGFIETVEHRFFIMSRKL